MVSRPHPHKERERRLRAAGFDWRDRIEALRANWDLETVKHLSLLNTAGWAGAAALKTVAGAVVPVSAFGYFGAGMVFAILCLWLVSFRHQRFMNEVTRRLQASKSDPSLRTPAFLLGPPDRPHEALAFAATAFGWGSGVAAVLGGAFLYLAL